MKELNSKNSKYLKVSLAILKIIEFEGVDSVTHSKVSRISAVSRAWIYEYMGKERSDLIAIAINIISEYFSKSILDSNIKNQEDFLSLLKTSQEISLSKVVESAIILKIYFRFKGSKTKIADIIVKYEQEWVENIQKNIIKFYNYSPEVALQISLSLLTMRMGIYFRVAVSSDPMNEIATSLHLLDLFNRNMLTSIKK